MALVLMAASTSSGIASTPNHMGALHAQDNGLHRGRVLYFDDLCGGLIMAGIGSDSKQPSCKGNLTDLRRILHLSLAKGNPK
jgi:hypothetical protein